MLEEAYRGPRPRVRFDGVTAIVSVADRALNLQGGSAGTLELEPRNVRGRDYSGEGESMLRPVIPIVNARNLGEVPIVQPQSGGE